jgi:orotate phosphoribosyltransferase
MADSAPSAFLDFAPARAGHFRLESGYHAALWLDLDAVFAEPPRIDPLVDSLADRLRPYRVDVVCGALVGGAFLAQLLSRTLDAAFCYTERVLPQASGLFGAKYRLPAAFGPLVRQKRLAILDDVMSAGSAMIGTCTTIQAVGGLPVVAAAVMVLGSRGETFFRDHNIPVEAVIRRDFDLWSPSDCPLCAKGVPLEDPGAAR